MATESPENIFIINNETYIVKLIFSYLDEQSETIMEQEVAFTFINNIQISNDIYTLVPTMRIILSDIGDNFVIKWPKDGRSLVSFILENVTQNQKSASIYILDKVTVLQQEGRFSGYQIDCTSPILFKMQSPVIYSTGDEELPYTEILTEILKQDAQDLFEEQTDLLETNNKGKFITLTQETLYDNISTLLNKSVSTETGIYYMSFDALIDQKLRLFNLGQVLEEIEDDEILPKINFCIDSTIASSSTNRLHTPYILVQENMINVTEYLQSIRYKKFHLFDRNNREWDSENKDWDEWYNKFNTALNLKDVPNIKDFTEILKGDSFSADKEIELRRPGNSSNIGININKIYKNLDTVYLEVLGHPLRKAGQKYLIISEDIAQQKNHRASALNGQWLITKIMHNFSKNTFKQHMHLCKFESLNPTPPTVEIE